MKTLQEAIAEIKAEAKGVEQAQSGLQSHDFYDMYKMQIYDAQLYAFRKALSILSQVEEQ